MKNVQNSKIKNNMNDLIHRNDDDLPAVEIYENLFVFGVVCCECGKKLSKEELLMHRYIGITKPEEMSCQGCWMKQAYCLD
jgi:hypothetical protein